MNPPVSAPRSITARIVGHSPLRVWGLTSSIRLARQLARFGVDAAHTGGDRVVLLRADWVYDDAIVRGLITTHDNLVLVGDDGSAIAVSVDAAHAGDAEAALAQRQSPSALRRVEKTDLAGDYNDVLRKREPPFLMPLTQAALPEIERRVFGASYKGVTDLVTRYVWPVPARAATRWCALHGITPNQVTGASFALVLAATGLFWYGHYGAGLLAAWLMTFLDTVDGKLARVTLQSTQWGNVFDHGIDLIHPPFWWWAWIVGLPATALPPDQATLALAVIVAGYVLQRIEEGIFIAAFDMDMHVWRRFDSRFRLITARRNPNLLILTVAVLAGRPDLGILAVAAWTALCLAVHALRIVQATWARRRGPLQSWLAASRQGPARNADSLRALLDDEWQRPVPPAVAQIAAHLAQRAQGRAAAVLYYGSTLRDDTLAGVLDFYILLDTVHAWPGSPAIRLANRVLPPNVGCFADTFDGRRLRTKYAVMSVAQFARRMSPNTLDTTLWARFCQPCSCVWSRSPQDRAVVAGMIDAAVRTAAQWAAALGPARGAADDYWYALFEQTYRVELRVEKAGRGANLIARDAARYARLLPAAWQAAGIAFDTAADGTLEPRLAASVRSVAARRWKLRQRLGKPLNILRLLKAVFTFEDAADYVVWKVTRHAGVSLEPSDWQRRHPLLAAPGIYFRLRKLGALR